MTTRFSYAAALLALLLAACGSSNDDAPSVAVSELPAGAYTVAAGDAATPAAGIYLAGQDGTRLLVLDDPGQQANALYWRDAGGKWQAAPGGQSRVELQASAAITGRTVDMAALAGSYVLRLPSGGNASLSLNASGDIAPGAGTCRLSGKAAPSTLPNALKLSLAASGCGALPAQADGYLVADADHAPAAFRLLVPGSDGAVDLWAYRE